MVGASQAQVKAVEGREYEAECDVAWANGLAVISSELLRSVRNFSSSQNFSTDCSCRMTQRSAPGVISTM